MRTSIILPLLLLLNINLTEAASPKEKALELARNFQRKHPPHKVKWDWAEAVFLYGATKYPELTSYLEAYHQRWLRKGIPRIDRSDRCPPALSALDLPWAKESVDKVIDYVRFEPRNRLGTIDHLGHSWFSWFYPSSIWVDSLMMYGVLAVKWADRHNDYELLDFGSVQPLRFAQVLQDEESGLFWHAYSFLSNKTIPRGKTFWLRGNGWTVTAIAEVLEALEGRPEFEERRQELRALLVKLSEGLLRWQKKNGAWETVINRYGYSYDETSGALLVAYGWAKAHRLGVLPKQYLEAARRAFAFAEGKLVKTKHGLSLLGSSGPTNPGPAIYYKLVHRRRDLAYGVGAFLLAADELEQQLSKE